MKRKGWFTSPIGRGILAALILAMVIMVVKDPDVAWLLGIVGLFTIYIMEYSRPF